MALNQGTNSYVTLAEAESYFEDSVKFEDWAAYGDEIKNRALVTATRLMERQVWKGEKTSSGQSLAFPRSGLTDRQGGTVDDSSIPDVVKNAQCELALALLEDSAVEGQNNAGSNIRSVRAGPTQVDYFRPTGGPRFPHLVHEMLYPFLSSASETGGPAGTGLSNDSKFDDSYKITGGLY